MSNHQSNMKRVQRISAIGLAILMVSTTTMANDSERITALEKEVQALNLRLSNLELTQPAANSRPKVVETKDGWKYVANWRSLKKGMHPDEVRSVLGEPEKVRASGSITRWNYPNRGSITFYEERLDGWAEPG